jgi:hypothetical protein
MLEEHTHEYFLSSGDLLHGGVVDAASSWWWAPLLVHRWCPSSRRVALLDHTVVLGEVAGFPTIEAQVNGWCRLLWWLEWCLLLLVWGSMRVLLQLLLWLLVLVLWAVAPLLRRRTMWLPHRWRVDQAVL